MVAEGENGKIIGFSTGGKERTGHYEGYKGELYTISSRISGKGTRDKTCENPSSMS
jgi:hypothetical protein